MRFLSVMERALIGLVMLLMDKVLVWLHIARWETVSLFLVGNNVLKISG